MGSRKMCFYRVNYSNPATIGTSLYYRKPIALLEVVVLDMNKHQGAVDRRVQCDCNTDEERSKLGNRERG